VSGAGSQEAADPSTYIEGKEIRLGEFDGLCGGESTYTFAPPAGPHVDRQYSWLDAAAEAPRSPADPRPKAVGLEAAQLSEPLSLDMRCSGVTL
jgi:hypothetical protein